MPRSNEKWVLPAVISLHLAIALPLAYYLNIWVDEASTLYATEQGFWTAFQNSAAEQKQAPLYFWLLSLWRYIDGSIFFARLFSIICSLGAIVAFAGLARKVLTPRAALVVTAFFGLHPFLIWASLEIRVYSFVILLSVILIRLFFDAFWDQPDRSRESLIGKKYSSLWFLLAAIIALYANYYLGFLLAGLFAALLITARWRAARGFALLMVVTAIAFLPLAYEMLYEFRSKSSGYQDARSVTEGFRILWHHFLTFTFPTELFPVSDQSAVSFLRLWIMRILVPAAALAMIWKRRQITSLTIALGCIAAVVALWLLAAYFLLGGQYTHVRHASVLFVPLVLFLVSLASDILLKLRPHTAASLTVIAACTFTAIFAYSTSVIYPNLTKRGDWARVAAFIEQNESPGQPILTFEAFDALALPYYYRGVNTVYPRENFFDFGLQGPVGTAESMLRQNEFLISKIPPGTGELWLVVNEFCISTRACQPLENYVKANYTIELEQDFYLVRIYFLRARSQ